MITSFGIVMLAGIIFGSIFKKINMPSLIGMIFCGIIVGPSIIDIINEELINISLDLRGMALIIILLRGGLSLNLKKVKERGREVILLSFLPGVIEILIISFLAPIFLGFTYIEGLILGSVLAAVSPAVIVPRMLKLQKEGFGKKKSIPELIMLGSSLDDIFIIILFTVFTSAYFTGEFNFISIVRIPIEIIMGCSLGILLGYLFKTILKKINIDDTVKVIIILGTMFILKGFEDYINNYFPISILVTVMTFGIFIYNSNKVLADNISISLNKIWVLAEILLFVLVGINTDIGLVLHGGVIAVILIVIALFFRIVAVYFLCLFKSGFNNKEKLFCSISYIPKATVQAAIGGLPLAMGVRNGDMILAISVISIIITAPIGATLIDNFYTKLLNR